jgi:radical SAM protein with 4Fe4S-binding SPASM domain
VRAICFEKIASVAHAIGTREIDILGGEPTLHPEIFSLLKINCSYGIKTTLSSNGSNVALLEKISKYFPGDMVSLGISLYPEAMRQDLHDFIFAFEPAVKSISTKSSFLPESAERYLNNEHLTYYAIFMDPITTEDLNDCLTFPEYLKKLRDAKKIFRNLEAVFCSGFIADERYPALKNTRCPAGTSKLSVLPDGSVYPCYLFFRNREFMLGNILKDEFSKIWNNPVLSFFRDEVRNPCSLGGCDFFLECHGGCPAVSFLLTQDISKSDPRCKYYI